MISEYNRIENEKFKLRNIMVKYMATEAKEEILNHH